MLLDSCVWIYVHARGDNFVVLIVFALIECFYSVFFSSLPLSLVLISFVCVTSAGGNETHKQKNTARGRARLLHLRQLPLGQRGDAQAAAGAQGEWLGAFCGVFFVAGLLMFGFPDSAVLQLVARRWHGFGGGAFSWRNGPKRTTRSGIARSLCWHVRGRAARGGDRYMCPMYTWGTDATTIGY